MSKIKSYFMEKMETDSEFRKAAELAELAILEPDFPSEEAQVFEGQEMPFGEEPHLKAA